MSEISLPKTIIVIPGKWTSRSDIVTSIARSSGGYLFAGAVMMRIGSKFHFSVDIYGRDDALPEAFEIAGQGRFSQLELAQINGHSFCVYLVGKGGSLENAQQFFDAGTALLNCGGLGVKIESAGTAHSPDQWKLLSKDGQLGSFLRAFVTYVGNVGKYYSCGMHNLGFPDAIVEASISPAEAADLLHTFVGFLLVDNPTLNSGETFSVAPNSPKYRLINESCSMFSLDDPFHNPFGIWKLLPV